MKQHADFFFDDLKVFLVEDTLFKVPIKELVNESEYFNSMFEDGTPALDAEKGEEGATIDHPIVIGDESAEAFALMMRWIYRRHTTKDFTTGEWVICLRVAHKFGIPLLSQVAQDALRNKTLDPVEKVRFCFEYDLDLAWATDAVTSICYSWNQLPLLPETDTFPLKFRLQCLKIREALLKIRNVPRSFSAVCWCDGCGSWLSPSSRTSENANGLLKERERCIGNGCQNPTALYMMPPYERKESVTESVLLMFAAKPTMSV
ncbi:hypothetical protein DL96DRAFT_1627843 [Flagelloscypha sp. PMI_526]|nr:hypothetical protein DL96DRAFT_1627843 [Flagelloscypha sp. PMI_526]